MYQVPLVDWTRNVTSRLSKDQLEAIKSRDFLLARKLGVSIEDYLRVIGCRNI